MFDEEKFLKWIDKEIKEIIENEIVFNEDVENILYDEDWELFKINDYEGGKEDGKFKAGEYNQKP
ncbi:MAG: hypothetical protein IJR47_05350 [Clostridia bacterium]|nr:hypothetical protein [Clostridia bacterium]